jgi:predicted nucleic acid-binding protein
MNGNGSNKMTNANYLIDTNIFIYLFNQRLAEPLPKGIPSCSIITEIELLSFANLSPQEEQIITKQLAHIPIFGLTDRIKQKTIFLRRQYHLKLPDAIIVATALVENLLLLTNDSKLHRIDDLQCKSISICQHD